MSELIFIVEESPEAGFTSRALSQAIFTEADTRAELSEKVRDAVRCHFEEGKGPKFVRLHHVREEVIAV
ncbi:MAG: 2-oxoisovalerate dehydrogenase [Nitrospira sp.]|nr:2-oxoisovalerate dehydrogenase [Nitrospira sp.]